MNEVAYFETSFIPLFIPLFEENFEKRVNRKYFTSSVSVSVKTKKLKLANNKEIDFTEDVNNKVLFAKNLKLLC